MKKIAHLFFLCLISASACAQNAYRFSGKETIGYFINGGVGYGTSYWNSQLKNTVLYDRSGGVINSGDLKFKTRTHIRDYDLNVMAPVADLMIGFGINFEENTMDKIDILTPNHYAGVMVYDQKFRFNRFYGLMEIPFEKEYKSNVSISVQARFGYLGYSGVDRENFFGVEKLSGRYFGGAGLVASYRLIPHMIIYFQPNFEYKYMSTHSIETPSRITHHITSFSATGGIRIDVSGK